MMILNINSVFTGPCDIIMSRYAGKSRNIMYGTTQSWVSLARSGGWLADGRAKKEERARARERESTKDDTTHARTSAAKRGGLTINTQDGGRTLFAQLTN